MVFHTDQKNVYGSQIARFRYEQGLSQSDLATKCQLIGWDVSRDIIARIEGQVRWVGDFELAALSKALGIGITELYPDGFLE